MDKIKVLQLSLDSGGVKTFVAHVLELADTNKFEFAVVAPENKTFRQFCESRQIKYYAVNLLRGLNPFSNAKALWQLVSIIKKERPRVIHAHSAKAGFLGRLAAKITGVRSIYTPHAFSYLPFNGVKRLIFAFLEVIAKPWTTCLLAISYSEAGRAINEIGFDNKKVEIVPNAIRVNDRINHVRSSETVNIRMIGRLTMQKNPLLFLEVAKQLCLKYNYVNFALLGAGIHDDLTSEIMDFIRDNNLVERVKIECWGDNVTSERFLAESDIYIMTSNFEGLPFSLLEAMSLGVPCVVTKVDGNTDVIDNNVNGFSCLGLEDFVSKTEMLVVSKPLREKIGIAGYEHVRVNHNITTTIKKIESVYETI